MCELAVQGASRVLDENLSLRWGEEAGTNIKVCLSVKWSALLTFALFFLLLQASSNDYMYVGTFRNRLFWSHDYRTPSS